MLKKMTALMVAVLLVLGCISGSVADEEVCFLQILGEETETVGVYEEIGEATPAAELKGGTLCALLDEKAVAGADWDQIIYLNEEKIAGIGWIAAEKAEKLTDEALESMMTDPDKANQLMDLIGAIAEMASMDPSAAAGTDATGNNAGSAGMADSFSALYEKGMEQLRAMTGNMDPDALQNMQARLDEALTGVVDDVKTVAGNVADKVQEKLPDLLEQASSLFGSVGGDVGTEAQKISQEAEKMLEGLKEALPGLKEKATGKLDEAKEAIGGLVSQSQPVMDQITEAASEAAQKVEQALKDANLSETVEQLQNSLKESAGGLGEGLSDLMTKIGNLFGNGN